MNINGLAPTNALSKLAQLGGNKTIPLGDDSNAADGFGSFVKDAVKSLENSQQSADTEIGKAVKGETTDLHKTIIELQSADLKFQLGLQVRNKFIGAYEEIMRMQV
jgi:flagellar hook-basal body complex protein FliE